MADIKIIIDGQVAELPPNGLNLPLTYSLRSREGLAINSGSRSEYSFELPGTKHNDSIFNQFYDPAIYTITEQAFLSASIEVDGLPFFIGRCQLQSVTLRQDQYFWQGKSYKVAFYGNNADWSTRIGDLLIKDLPFTAHTYSYADNLAHWVNTYPTNDFKYLPLKLKDYTTFGQLDGLEDSHPAIFVVDILNKAFASIGYTMISFFFNSAFAERLIMPVPILNRYLQGQYGEDYLNIAAENTNPYLPYAPIANVLSNFLDNQTVTPPNPPNPYSTILSQYVIPQTGYYLVKCYTKIYDLFFTAPSVDCFFLGFVSEDGNPVFDWFWGGNVIVDSVFSFERLVFKNAGQTLDFGYTGGGDAISSPTSYYKADYKIQVIGEAEILDGFNLNLRYVIDPSLKVIDLIRGLSHAFNLVFETNEGSRTVYIEPADDFILESRPASIQLEDGFYTAQKGFDYTPFVDLSKGGELVSDTKQLSQLRLKWKDDSSDPTVEALNLNQNLGILEARFQFSINRFKEGETVVENPFFAPTLVIADDEIAFRGTNNEIIKTPMLPIIWAVNYLETSTSAETVTQIVPRLLVSDPIPTGEENGVINVYNGSAVVDLKNPLNYMIDYNDTSGFQTSLSFGDVTVNGFNVAGLLKRFYLSEMVRKKGGKYLELFILWDVLKIQNLTFRDKILINNNTYILQEINTFNVAKNQSTKTYFVLDSKEVGADADIQSTILAAKLNTV
jgi:hypothetical protein